MADIVQQELAVRAAIMTVAPTGSFLIKAASPGRLYEPKTVAEVQTILGVGSGGYNIDGGKPDSNYGGSDPLDGGVV